MVPRIKKVAFGDIEINDEVFNKEDFFLFWDGIEVAEKTHEPSLRDFEEMMLREPDVVIIGTGFNSLVKVSKEIREKAKKDNIEMHTLPTPDALKLFKELTKKGKKVAARIHTTC